MKTSEANFDGLVGMTHNYAGLSKGNIASLKNKAQISNPKQAAKQGLLKMKALADMGLLQGVLPPHERPRLDVLQRLGFTGNASQMLEKAGKEAPEVLNAVYSASSMWVANTATVSPSTDTADGKVHFTPANLVNQFHRSLEWRTTQKVFQSIFQNDQHFVIHDALPEHAQFGDEGAANHTRFCQDHSQKGVHFLTFGCYSLQNGITPSRFPARQTYEASQAIVRQHGLDPQQVVFAQHHPNVIDSGVFHNDVIAVGNQNVHLCHETAFLNFHEVQERLKTKLEGDFYVISVSEKQVSLGDAVNSYLFNSQIVTLPDGKMVFVAPSECHEVESVKDYLVELVEDDNPISCVKTFNLRESMKNGGGPACLRLRVVLNQKEEKAVNPHVWLNETSFARLNQWVDHHYRDRLSADDLKDPKLMQESQTALDELTQILKLGPIYNFQRL